MDSYSKGYNEHLKSVILKNAKEDRRKFMDAIFKASQEGILYEKESEGSISDDSESDSEASGD